MKKQEKKRYIILFLTGIFLLKVLSCSIVPESEKKYTLRCKPMNENRELSESEVDEFLEMWKIYIQNGYDKKVQDKISLIDGNIEDNLPISVKLWFKAKCWTANRFYYVEDRLKATLRTIYLRRHAQGIISILQETINDNNATEYKYMIDMQNQIANIENISNNEVKFVQMRETEIADILNMQ